MIPKKLDGDVFFSQSNKKDSGKSFLHFFTKEEFNIKHICGGKKLKE